MPICGSCKDHHDTVQEIRDCSNDERVAVFSYVGPNPWTTDGRSCEKCSGSGVYCWGGTNNGVPQFSGTCFACSGKGWQSDCGEVSHDQRAADILAGVRDMRACCDRVRNDLYWRFGVRIYM